MRRALAALAIATFALACGCDKSKKKAVPAEVDVVWPDAAVFPGEQTRPEQEPDATPDAAPEPSDGSTAEN